MLFTDIRTEVMDRLGYTSTTAETRVGRAINKIYREVGTSIGMSFARQTATSITVTTGTANQTFTATEKVLQVWRLDGSSNPIVLGEVLLAELRDAIIPDNDKPTVWALVSTTSNAVTIRLNAAPETAYTLYADVIAEVSDLSGSNEPAFPESFHDILIEGVLKDEYRKQEKIQLARDSDATFQRRLSDLRMFVAKSAYQDIQQGKLATSASSRANAGGSSASLGLTALTITGLWTFDRDPSAPFAVSASSTYVANLISDNVYFDASPRIMARYTSGAGNGEEATLNSTLEFSSGALQRAALTGDVTATAGSNTTAIAAGAIVTADISDDQVTYAKMQDVSAAARLLGRGGAGGSGNVEELDLAGSLSLAATTLSVAPGGSDTHVQFNDSSVLAGDAGLTYNKTTDTLTAGGVIVGTAGVAMADNVIGRPELKDYAETRTAPTISAGTLTLNLENGNVFDVSLNADITTLTISNPPATGKCGSFTLIFTADGTLRAVTWPAAVLWPSASAPTLTSTSTKKDVFIFLTTDAGTSWLAAVAGQNY